MVKIRLKRMGYKKNPVYRVVVINSTSRREGAPIQELGFYNPKTKEMKLDKAAALDWLSKGAQATETVAYLIKNGYLARTGEPIATLPDFDGIRLLNSDIESVQLAKSAVRTGIELLMNEADCRESDIECLYLSGSFGAFLNAESAKSIGMIPNVPTKAIGNAALSGAVMALLDSSVTERAKSAAGAVKCIEIADSTAFENAFINNLPFQEGI